MPRKRSRAPGYRYHMSGQAVVTLDGRNFYLGEHGTPESWAKYYALLAEYNANGQRMPEKAETHKADQPITVRCLTAEYRLHIEKKFAKAPKEIYRCKSLCSLLEDEHTPLYPGTWVTIRRLGYWYGVWSLQRDSLLWKGFLAIDLDGADDRDASSQLAKLAAEVKSS